VEKAHNFRRYTVDAGQLIKVTFFSCNKYAQQWLYLANSLGFPYPLQKDAGEEEDAWAIKDVTLGTAGPFSSSVSSSKSERV
jgi:hypothetical protein